MRISCKWLVCAAVLGMCIGGVARADVIAYDNIGAGPNQNFGNSLGLDFNVTSATGITVTALGAYDSGAIGALVGVDGVSGVTVAIYDRVTQLQVGPSVHFDGTNGVQINSNAFLPDLINLPGGFQGSVVAFNDPNYNSGGGPNPTSTENDGGGLISFVGGGRFGGGFAYPTIVDGGPTNRYDAGTFEFVAGVPEPGTLTLAGLGLLGLVGYCWRSRKGSA